MLAPSLQQEFLMPKFLPATRKLQTLADGDIIEVLETQDYIIAARGKVLHYTKHGDVVVSEKLERRLDKIFRTGSTVVLKTYEMEKVRHLKKLVLENPYTEIAAHQLFEIKGINKGVYLGSAADTENLYLILKQ